MLPGIVTALGAGLVWGLVFIVPLLLPEYSGVQLSFGRYTAFGLIALVVAMADRRGLARLRRADWIMAAKLSLVGNIAYYAALASAIQLADAPLPTMIIGTLPVWISLFSNLTSHRSQAAHETIPWKHLLWPLLIILTGIIFVNISEMSQLGNITDNPSQRSLQNYFTGIGCSLAGLAAWTWYPIQNSRHIKHNHHIHPITWATAQGITTLPVALLGLLLYALVQSHQRGVWVSPLGPDAGRFCLIMLVIGLMASWVGTLLWNFSSRHLPTALAGQLIVFETLAALLYAFLLRGTLPPPMVLAGAVLLCLGVALAVRLFQASPVANNNPGCMAEPDLLE